MPTPKHKTTELSRAVVQALAGYGLNYEDIAKHPDVNVGLPTLSDTLQRQDRQALRRPRPATAAA